eukprot:1516292-Heterocapsa_arctica.AAC.1
MHMPDNCDNVRPLRCHERLLVIGLDPDRHRPLLTRPDDLAAPQAMLHDCLPPHAGAHILRPVADHILRIKHLTSRSAG